MMQNFSLHTHTTFSDGKSTIDEMLAQAVKLGFESYGITDHLSVYDYDNPAEAFGKKLPLVKQHTENIRLAAKNYSLKVYVGFEVDYYNTPGWLDAFESFHSKIDVDYLITGNHYALDNSGRKKSNIVRMSTDLPDNTKYDEYLHNHFVSVREAVCSKQFAFLAHLDYARWGSIMHDGDYKDEIMDIVYALAETSTAVELNTKGLDRIGDFYPSSWILKELNAHGVSVVISDDVHHTSEIARYFPEAEKLLSELNYQKRFSL